MLPETPKEASIPLIGTSRNEITISPSMTDNDDASVNEKNIKVFVRIFPLKRSCESCAKLDMDRKKIYVRCLQDMQPNRISPPKKPSYWCFQADEIFFDSSQEEVYRYASADLVSKILGGVSCVLMGYGQTGSGKSFTISGLRNNWEHRGLVPRLLSQMFAERTNRKDVSKIEYRVSFVELYGREAKDLLAPDTESKVKINERDPFKEVSTISVDNEQDGLKKIFEGEFRRSIAKGSTSYPASHLATAVITFHVSNTSLITSWGVVTTAKIHIVEAAGTGTVGRNIHWKTATDIGMANLTKTQLEQFFSYIAGSGSFASIARSSNLLKILGSAFSVSSIIRFIPHVRIAKEELDITLSTLRFTAKIARLKPVRLKEDIEGRSDLVVHRLQDEVNSLRKEMMISELLLRQEAPGNISRSRMEQIYRSVLNFLNDSISDLTLYSVSHTQVLLKTVKDLYNRLTAKELEVDKLKETYEHLLKTVSDATVTSPENLISHRKLDTGAPQDIFQVEESKEEEEKEEVGSIDKSTVGVTLGPYTDEEADPEKSFDNGRQSSSMHVLKIDERNTETVRQLFDSFLKEEREYARLKEQFDKNERILGSVRQRFSNTIDRYFQAKRNLNDARDQLRKQRQIRYTWELENREGNEVLLEMEKAINRDILCHQKVLVSLEEEVNQTQKELNALSNRYIEMSLKIKFGFHEYCKRQDLLLHFTDKSMKIILAFAKMESMEAIRRKFNKFQRTILRKAES